MCGERLPKRAGVWTSRSTSGFSNVLFMASLGLTAYSFLSPYKLPLSVTLGISGGLFLLSVVDRLVNRNAGKPNKHYARAASRLARP